MKKSEIKEMDEAIENFCAASTSYIKKSTSSCFCELAKILIRNQIRAMYDLRDAISSNEETSDAVVSAKKELFDTSYAVLLLSNIKKETAK